MVAEAPFAGKERGPADWRERGPAALDVPEFSRVGGTTDPGALAAYLDRADATPGLERLKAWARTMPSS